MSRAGFWCFWSGFLSRPNSWAGNLIDLQPPRGILVNFFFSRVFFSGRGSVAGSVLWAERCMPEGPSTGQPTSWSTMGLVVPARRPYSRRRGAGAVYNSTCSFPGGGGCLRLWRVPYTVRKLGVSSVEALLNYSLLGGVLLGGQWRQSGSSDTKRGPQSGNVSRK